MNQRNGHHFATVTTHASCRYSIIWRNIKVVVEEGEVNSTKEGRKRTWALDLYTQTVRVTSG